MVVSQLKNSMQQAKGRLGSLKTALAGAVQFRPIVYGFSNARIHAMRSLLLSTAQLDEIAAQPSVQGIIQVLERSPYKEDIVAYALRYRGASLVEHALGRNFSRAAKKVVSFAPQDGKETVQGFLERYDVNNLRTILIGKHLKKSREDIEDKLVLVGQMGPLEVSQLLGAQSVEDALAVIRTHRYGSVLWSIRKDGIEKILATLDKLYYMNVQKKVTSIDPKARGVLKMLKVELDGKNVSTIMRCKAAGMKSEAILELVIAGGNFAKNDISQMIEAQGIEQVATVAAKRYHGLDATIAKYTQTKRISEFEIAFGKMVGQLGAIEFRKSALSVATLIGFLMLKESRMENIRKIVRGREFGLAPERIKELLVEVG